MQCQLEGENVGFDTCHHIEKTKLIILLEMNDKCEWLKPNIQKGEGNKLNHGMKAEPFEK